MERDTLQLKSTLTVKDQVLSRVRAGDIKPTSRLWFRGFECLVWLLWALTVLIGAIAFAVLDMVWSVRSRDIFEITHNSPLELLFSALPYLWIVVFGAMTVFAVINFRQTRKGYRYPVGHIIGSSLLFSVVGGLVLHAAGVGMVVDREFGEHMPMYMSQEKMEIKLWQMPEAGRLVGMFVSTSTEEGLILFADVLGGSWQVNVEELQSADRDWLMARERVRVLGLPTVATNTFYACGVFPWLFETGMPEAMISAERAAFLARMYEHKASAERLAALQDETIRNNNKGDCAKLEAIGRIEASMH